MNVTHHLPSHQSGSNVRQYAILEDFLSLKSASNGRMTRDRRDDHGIGQDETEDSGLDQASMYDHCLVCTYRRSTPGLTELLYATQPSPDHFLPKLSAHFPAPTPHLHAQCSTALALSPGQLESQQQKRHLRHRSPPIPPIAVSSEEERPVQFGFQ
jgi:hypothetical protein